MLHAVIIFHFDVYSVFQFTDSLASVIVQLLKAITFRFALNHLFHRKPIHHPPLPHTTQSRHRSPPTQSVLDPPLYLSLRS